MWARNCYMWRVDLNLLDLYQEDRQGAFLNRVIDACRAYECFRHVCYPAGFGSNRKRITLHSEIPLVKATIALSIAFVKDVL